MNLSQLYYFQIVAEEEHISRAAEKLHVSQPSLSTTIRRLETELGTPLFDRRGRNIFLNDAGKKLLEHVNFIFSQIDLLNKDLEQKEFHIAHGLSMAVNNNSFLDGWLSRFILDNPGARITQRTLPEEEMLRALEAETIDLAIGNFTQVPEGIHQHVLVEDEYLVAVPVSHPLGQRQSLRFEDIRSERFTALPSNSANCFIYPLFAQKNATPNVIFEGNINMMLKLFFKQNALLFSTRQLMYTYLRYNLKPQLLGDDPPGFKLLPIDDIDTTYNLSLCWKEDRALPVMAVQLRDALIHDYVYYSRDEEFLASLPTVL